MGLGAEDGDWRLEVGFLLNLRIWGSRWFLSKKRGGWVWGGTNRMEAELWGVWRVGWECCLNEWGVKSLFWGVISNGVRRDIKGV